METKIEYKLEDLPENIKGKIEVVDGHWIWKGTIRDKKRKHKQGVIRFNGSMKLIHRVVNHLLTGYDLNSPLLLLHIRNCNESLCCYPGHLYEGDEYLNAQDREATNRGRYANQLRCPSCNGEYKVSPTTGHRYCSYCKNARKERWRARKKLEGVKMETELTKEMKEMIEKAIKDLEKEGKLDPNCKGCEEFYEQMRKGKQFWTIFAPRHKASESCRSGKRNHCTCDTCF